MRDSFDIQEQVHYHLHNQLANPWSDQRLQQSELCLPVPTTSGCDGILLLNPDQNLSLRLGREVERLEQVSVGGLVKSHDVAKAIGRTGPGVDQIVADSLACDDGFIRALVENGFSVTGGEAIYEYSGLPAKPVEHPQVHFSSFGREHLTAAVELVRSCPACREADRLAGADSTSEPDLRSWLEHVLEQEHLSALVAQSPVGDPVGLVVWTLKPGAKEQVCALQLQLVCCHTQWRGKGLFEMLVRQVLATEMPASGGRACMSLPLNEHVAGGELRALLKLGFQVLETHLMFVLYMTDSYVPAFDRRTAAPSSVSSIHGSLPLVGGVPLLFQGPTGGRLPTSTRKGGELTKSIGVGLRPWSPDLQTCT